MKTWKLPEAKSKFNQLVDSAMNSSPQIITKRGKNAVVVISYKDYEKFIKHEQGIVGFFQNSPLTNIALDLKRGGDPSET